jgi:hypothetical protein
MAAAPCAQSSADTRALMQIPTSAGQHAETPSSLALSNATTATPTVAMDAVQTATRLRLDGRALPWRVVGPVARAAMQGHTRALRQHPHASAAMQGHIQSQLALRQHLHA